MSTTVTCDWCGDQVAALPTVVSRRHPRRYVRLQPHEDIYPTRACEGGNHLFDLWEKRCLSRDNERCEGCGDPMPDGGRYTADDVHLCAPCFYATPKAGAQEPTTQSGDGEMHTCPICGPECSC